LSHQRFERLVRRALAALPEEFRSRLENVAVLIEDEPPEDMPDTLGLYVWGSMKEYPSQSARWTV